MTTDTRPCGHTGSLVHDGMDRFHCADCGYKYILTAGGLVDAWPTLTVTTARRHLD